MTMETIVALVGDSVAIAFILWLVHRMTTVTIPRIAAEFREGLENQREDFKEALKTQREQFAIEMERERQNHSAIVERVIDAIKEQRV